jgi:hypothetical protein
MYRPDPLDLNDEGIRDRRGERRHSVMSTLPAPDDQLTAPGIHVLHPKPHPLHEPETGPVEHAGDEPVRSVKLLEEGTDLVTGQDDRKSTRFPGPGDSVRKRDSRPEDFVVQKEEGARRLSLGRRADPTLVRQVGQEGRHLSAPHVPGMARPVETHETADPTHVRLLRSPAVLACPRRPSYELQELRRAV